MSQEWYRMIDGRPQRPVSGQQLIQLAKDGGLRPDDDVWTEGEKPFKARELKVLEGPFFSGRKKDGHSGTTTRPGPRGLDNITFARLEAGETVTITKSDLELLQAIYDLKVVDNGPSYSISLRAESDALEMDVQGGKPGTRSTHLIPIDCPNCGAPGDAHPNVAEQCKGCEEATYFRGCWYGPDGKPFPSDDDEYDDADNGSDDVGDI